MASRSVTDETSSTKYLSTINADIAFEKAHWLSKHSCLHHVVPLMNVVGADAMNLA